MSERTCRKKHDVAAQGFGIGNNRWAKLIHNRTNNAGISLDCSDVEFAILHGIAKRFAVQQMQPYIALADDESDRRSDIFTGMQITNHLDTRTHLGENYVLLIHDRLFKLRVFCVAENSAKFRAIEWVE
jgi:hypothetical protein